ncbi:MULTISPECIES: 5'-nucleotidase C-terminal domain-containing protein [unclassified Capnocytophaga]|jgi:5''-nucleotidase/2'',3''-cyclic phosphodiesterase and related esterases|uniref:5'-nucleotidase C-terminal domain-containing protein n=1 Tax=unclassified Capnocytophaga TaxID=2640652 RepID=UPI000202C637|nr:MULTISPECIES: 5'-nucleotidase C-terminal domain-containing protein [unclassified Capnocytophaga]EGD33526.1 5'-nucleotidase domain protein [Capnocytophaga sp. oral taxon 338 str. F0234]MEB3004178.1 5'-nucleotidase C-terminal domain-containing protein [Capnocytophaga sp. G2]
MKKIFLGVFALLLLLSSCKSSGYYTQALQGEQLQIGKETEEDEQIKDYLSPFRYHLNKYLDKVLSYNKTAMIKVLEADVMNMPIGNFFADSQCEQADSYFLKKKKRHIDFAMFNWGGIRTEIPQGDITIRQVYQIMPFENQLVVVELTGDTLYKMAKYLIENQLPHPLSKQVQLTINKRGDVVSFLINKRPVQRKKRYFVCTFDYLYQGGDRMNFFKDALSVTNINYPSRDAIIDYLRKTDTLDFKTDERFRIKK